jgi:AraC family transcriptional regulator of adaptative response/methylated-DNA-[protein]-cysteine methyltransferase
MTPATYGRHGEGAAVAYTVVDGAPGKLLAAATAKGICAVRFGDSESELEAGLKAEFSRAAVVRDDEALAGYAGVLADALAGGPDATGLPVDIRATAFQRRVWEALRSIPAGETRSYSDVARAIGQPRAVRAVANACAANPAALTVPCHRVVRQDGEPGEYRWGAGRKQMLLERERARSAGGENPR